ncbi:MAG: histidinol-phosphate transaminase [Bacteroidia bacterium]
MVDLEKLVRPSILKLKPYSSARDEYTGGEGIFVDANENPYGSLNRYPDPYQKELKQKLSELKDIAPNRIFVGNGSDEVIDLAFRIFCSPGIHKALTCSPTYGMYDVSSTINDVDLTKVPLQADFQLDIKGLTAYFNDPSFKLLFLCSPNNPTGNSLRIEDIELVLNQFKGIVILDEAYIDFSSEQSLIPLVENYNNLIVSQTFSKAWGLASARVGIAYSNTEIISLYNKVKPPYNISGINQKAALNALNKTNDYKANLESILEQKKCLKKQLDELEIVKKIYPSDANFFLIEVDNADKRYNQLSDLKIIVRNRNTQVKNCLRITVGTAEENNALIEQLKAMK